MATKTFDDGLLYVAKNETGRFMAGWCCREDHPSYGDIEPWIDAIHSIAECADGYTLQSLVRCSHKDAMRIIKSYEG